MGRIDKIFIIGSVLGCAVFLGGLLDHVREDGPKARLSAQFDEALYRASWSNLRVKSFLKATQQCPDDDFECKLGSHRKVQYFLDMAWGECKEARVLLDKWETER